MKLILAALCISSASAFTTSSFGLVKPSRIVLFAEENAASGRINSKIDLENAKVVNTESLEAGEKKVFCRCWKSGTFPLCDAAHVQHNKDTGDNVGPLIVSAAK